MENPTNEYPEPRTEYIEARKVSMVTLDTKEVPLVKVKATAVEEDEVELVKEKEYIPTSNLLQVRSVAFATMEEEQAMLPLKEEVEEPKENKEHKLFYGAVMGGKAEVDRTMEEKKINKQC